MNRLATTLTTATGPAIWGTTYVVSTELLPSGRPLLAAAIRCLPAGLLMVAMTRALPRGRWWGRAVVLGLLNMGAFQALLFVSAYRLPGGVAQCSVQQARWWWPAWPSPCWVSGRRDGGSAGASWGCSGSPWWSSGRQRAWTWSAWWPVCWGSSPCRPARCSPVGGSARSG